MAFENITAEQHRAFLYSLKHGHYNLLTGAGVSLDSSNPNGHLPSGGNLKSSLCALKGADSNKSLQKVFALLSPDEIHEHVTNRLANSIAGPTQLAMASFIWKRAYTFNIDDAMENAYSGPNPLQTLIPFNFDDPYEEAKSLTELQLLHLHGSVRKPKSGYVFSRNEYIQQLRANSPWLTVLSQFMRTEPFLIVGSSLDEVDLEYYLSFRKPTSGRDDRGPSILVEPCPDATTRNECVQHGLVLFVGTALDFFNYCNREAPERPTPVELIPTEKRRLFPPDVSKPAFASFWSDFELVPGTAGTDLSDSRFLLGHAPTWSDLEASVDIARPISLRLIEEAERSLGGGRETVPLILLSSGSGTGKTTVLRRCAYELAKKGKIVLHCSALSRLEPGSTASMLDLIDGPVVIIADNFADQAVSFVEILSRMEKEDVVILAAERSYRFIHIKQIFAGVDFKKIDLPEVRQGDIAKLIEKYVEFGIVGDKRAISHSPNFFNEVKDDPIAVACCRILNDFRPLDRVIAKAWDDAKEEDQDRYLIASLAQYCFSGGVRYSILAGAVTNEGLKHQLRKDHPLPLAFSSDLSNSFVVPQNATFSSRLLKFLSETDRKRLLGNFVALANEIAPRVNRSTIKSRTPEARLARRLFDFDTVVEEYLHDLALNFYTATQAEWQWNSRYWEQIALLKLTLYQRSPKSKEGQEALEMAVRHAKHAVAIEHHPFPLSTLGKALLIQMNADGYSRTASFNEAFAHLTEAIRLEREWSRMAPQAFVLLFRGARDFLAGSGEVSRPQIDTLLELISESKEKFPRDDDVTEVADALYVLIGQ
jgi:hypothetical protein